MAPAKPDTHVEVTVRKVMNHHDTMTVEVTETNETRHLVEYGSSQLKETLSSLPEGTTLPLTMRPVGTRANVWQVTGTNGRTVGSSRVASLD